MQCDWSSQVWLLSFIHRFPEFILELNPKKFSKHCWCFYWIFDKSVSNVLALWTGDLERAYHRRFVELQRLRSMWAILVLTWPFLLSASTESEFARTFSQWLCLYNPGNSGQIFCIMVCPGFGLLIIYLSTPTVRSSQSQWVVMAALHCYSWWRWWSDTLWATLIKLWLHSLSCYLQIDVCGDFSTI
jgi:hypothetical protein